MKRLLAVFVLTRAEQCVVVFVVLLLLAGAWFKHHRDLKYNAAARATPISTPAPHEH